MSNRNELAGRRRARVRNRIRRKKGATNRPRLTVLRSNKNIYAQIIDDARGVTLAAASTMDKDVRDKVKNGADKDAAATIGKMVAERAVANGVKEVVFDRGPYLYHGRIKALADAARESGLSF